MGHTGDLKIVDTEAESARRNGYVGTIRIILCAFLAQLSIGVLVSIGQASTVLLGWHAISIDSSLVPLFVVFGIPFSSGGFSARLAFETLVGPLEFLVGHRYSTVFSNLPLYLALLTFQMAVLTWIVQARFRRT